MMACRISRRNAVLGVAGALASLAIPTPARAQATVLHVSTVTIFDSAPFYAAESQGYFRAENLAVTTEAVQSGAAGVPALLNGQFDVLYGNVVSTIQAIEKGFDLRIAMGGSPNPTTAPGSSSLMKRRGDAIRTGKDLEGKIVGVNGINGINWVLTRSWVKMTGGDPQKVNFIELPYPALVDAIKAKRIDAAYVVDPFMTSGLTDPEVESFAWPQVSVSPGLVNGLWIVTKQTTEQRPELVRAFVRGLRRGAAWINANLGNESYIKLVSGYTKIDPALATKMKLVPAATTISAAQIQPMVKLMRDNGLISADVDMRSRLFV
jgi:NitT/TauT family transport system substrate-binding protein